jgi:hypothetical protein
MGFSHVYLVYLVCLVCLVELEKPDKPNEPEEPDKLVPSPASYGALPQPVKRGARKLVLYPALTDNGALGKRRWAIGDWRDD